jgi:RNA polymerase nonessential primary-like sigma factor
LEARVAHCPPNAIGCCPTSLPAAPLRQRRLTQQLDHEPNVHEVAEQVGKSGSTVEKFLKMNERVQSVDAPAGKDHDKSLLDTLTEAAAPSPDEWVQVNHMESNVRNWVGQLGDKHREVLCRRYGLFGFEAQTLEQVALELGVTRERVRQIQIDGLKKLKTLLESSGYNAAAIF